MPFIYFSPLFKIYIVESINNTDIKAKKKWGKNSKVEPVEKLVYRQESTAQFLKVGSIFGSGCPRVKQRRKQSSAARFMVCVMSNTGCSREASLLLTIRSERHLSRWSPEWEHCGFVGKKIPMISIVVSFLILLLIMLLIPDSGSASEQNILQRAKAM